MLLNSGRPNKHNEHGHLLLGCPVCSKRTVSRCHILASRCFILDASVVGGPARSMSTSRTPNGTMCANHKAGFMCYFVGAMWPTSLPNLLSCYKFTHTNKSAKNHNRGSHPLGIDQTSPQSLWYISPSFENQQARYATRITNAYPPTTHGMASLVCISITTTIHIHEATTTCTT